MSPFILFTLLFLITLYALAWHDKPAGQHFIDKLPGGQHPGAEKERSRIKLAQTDNFRANSRLLLPVREWKQTQFTPMITTGHSTIVCEQWIPARATECLTDSAREKGGLQNKIP